MSAVKIDLSIPPYVPPQIVYIMIRSTTPDDVAPEDLAPEWWRQPLIFPVLIDSNGDS